MSKQSKWLRFGFRVCVGLFVALLMVYFSLPLIIRGEFLRNRILNPLQSAVNGQVFLQSARLETFPVLGLRLQGVKLVNGQAFGHQEALVVEHAHAGIEVVPLFRKRLHVFVRLEKPKIILLKNAVGQNNLADLFVKPGETKAPSSQQDRSDLGWINRVVLSEVNLDQGDFIFGAMEQRQEDVHLAGIDVRFLNVTTQGNFDFDIGLVLRNHGDLPVVLKGRQNGKIDLNAGIYTLDFNPLILQLGSQRIRLSATANLEGKTSDTFAFEMAMAEFQPYEVLSHLNGAESLAPSFRPSLLTLDVKAKGYLADLKEKSPPAPLQNKAAVKKEDAPKPKKPLAPLKPIAGCGEVNVNGSADIQFSAATVLQAQYSLKPVNLNAQLKPQDFAPGVCTIDTQVAYALREEVKKSLAKPLLPGGLNAKVNFTGRIKATEMKHINQQKEFRLFSPDLFSADLLEGAKKDPWVSIDAAIDIGRGDIMLKRFDIELGWAKGTVQGMIDAAQALQLTGKVQLGKSIIAVPPPPPPEPLSKKKKESKGTATPTPTPVAWDRIPIPFTVNGTVKEPRVSVSLNVFSNETAPDKLDTPPQ